jgi:4-amino-4-deoxy-L-arabinose transferase-like glycosyltransferase
LKRGDIVNLWWNGKAFTDHPPAGFWFIAISYRLLGISDFSARAVQAFSGILTLVFVFFLGKKLFNRLTGVLAALALSSSPWFIYRARSGNLDAILTMFFVLTVLLALYASKNRKLLIAFILSLSLLFLTKTAAPFTIIPVILLIFWRSKHIKFKDLFLALGIFLGIFGGWFLYQVSKDAGFFRHYFKIGLPGVESATSYLDNLALMKEYLHNGIGKWFWPGIISIFLGVFTFQKRFFILFIFFISFFLPFLTSSKGHIWQLIPLHPFIILAFFGFMWVVGDRISLWIETVARKLIKKKSIRKFFVLSRKPIFVLSVLVIFLYFYVPQAKRNWFEFIDIPAFVSDEAILSREASKFKEKFYIDEDFGPSAVFYSEKNVKQIRNEELQGLFESDERFVLITHQWRLDGAEIPKKEYEIIKTDRDKLLIKRI